MDGNLRIYDAGKYVPKDALKPITAGRLKGMSNINPMWRIRKLTELFGPAGIGWYTEELGREVYPGANGEAVAALKINLYIKDGGEWSKPIFGEGGALLIASEKSGLHTNDEAWKCAYTDALSVACKALGIAAEVYYAADYTKYTEYTQAPPAPVPEIPAEAFPDAVTLDNVDTVDVPVCEACGTPFKSTTIKGVLYSPVQVAEIAKQVRGRCICKACASGGAK